MGSSTLVEEGTPRKRGDTSSHFTKEGVNRAGKEGQEAAERRAIERGF